MTADPPTLHTCSVAGVLAGHLNAARTQLTCAHGYHIPIFGGQIRDADGRIYTLIPEMPPTPDPTRTEVTGE